MIDFKVFFLFLLVTKALILKQKAVFTLKLVGVKLASHAISGTTVNSPQSLGYIETYGWYQMSFEISFIARIGTLSFLFFLLANGEHETYFKWHLMMPHVSM